MRATVVSSMARVDGGHMLTLRLHGRDEIVRGVSAPRPATIGAEVRLRVERDRHALASPAEV